MKKYNGLEKRVTVKEWMDEGKFIIEFITGGQELASCNGIINKYKQKNEEGIELHVFIEILDHEKKGNKYFIQIK